MNRAALLTLAVLLTSSPFSLAKSELEELRTRCAEQERQIRDLEEENTKLRLMVGKDARYANRQVAAASPQAPVATSPNTPRLAGEATTYTVVRGDSWERIARKFGTRADRLAELNGTKSTAMLREGRRLKVPAAEKTAAAPTSAASAAIGTGTYRIQQNDTYYSIGRKLGIPTSTLIAANPAVKATALRPGLVIQLGKPTEAATTATAKPAAPAAPMAYDIPTGSAQQTVSIPAATPGAPMTPVTIDNSTTTYGAFAAKHGTTVSRLNKLNYLDLVESTLLAKGSELYVPAQP